MRAAPVSESNANETCWCTIVHAPRRRRKTRVPRDHVSVVVPSGCGGQPVAAPRDQQLAGDEDPQIRDSRSIAPELVSRPRLHCSRTSPSVVYCSGASCS